MTFVDPPRRTFAVISHPDAGKTTLTEKLLYFGGAIRLAGQVKAKGARRRAQSDWMAMERERGISVSSSVMTFTRDGVVYNLLDTPGHQDFSEDTYRVLTAVDSAIMVLDAAKGIESQTLKLLEICRLRDIPIITFINKVDRESLDPFELLDEVESRLALDLSPVTWPVGTGSEFHGCYDLRHDRFLAPEGDAKGPYGRAVDCNDLFDAKLDEYVRSHVLGTFRENAALARSAYPQFDAQAYREGHMSPVLFGSALKDFAVPELLDLIAEAAPGPRTQPADPEPVRPDDARVSGFVFKVQANMDANHRDRVAFMRICSGRFRRGMKLRQTHTGKQYAVHNPIFFFAQERALAEEALPGDIIGIPNHGTLRVGDTLSERADLRFTGLPEFAPEILRRVLLDDPMKSKQLRTALEDLSEEGAMKLFRPTRGAHWVVGVIGELQLEVIAARIEAEYGIKIRYEYPGVQTARWIGGGPSSRISEFEARYPERIAHDRDGALVFMARDDWDIQYTEKNWPDISFAAVKERKRM